MATENRSRGESWVSISAGKCTSQPQQAARLAEAQQEIWCARRDSNSRPIHLQALDQFNQAVAQDPNYAQAYAGLAYAYVLLFDRGWISPEEASPKIRSAAQRAIELDPTLAEPHAALAALKELADWDWAGAHSLRVGG